MIIYDRHYKKPINEKCGVVAVWDRQKDAPLLAERAILALQHRGQESAGITVHKKTKGLVTHKKMGLINEVLTDKVMKKLGRAKSAIAQNRYSTTGDSSSVNCQPFTYKNRKYAISIGHNGNIPDLSFLNNSIIKKPKATSDTALIATLLLQNRKNYNSWTETFKHTLPEIHGAYCLTVITEDGSIFGIRDPYGIRPLCLGQIDGDGWIIASESVGIDAVGGNFLREIKRGEIVHISNDGIITSTFFGEPKRQMTCLFEYVYFSRPDSYINGKRIKDCRVSFGHELGKRIKEKGIKPEVIVPIFNSGYYPAKGVAAELGIPIIEAFITSNYFGRTFIYPAQYKRIKAVNGKHNVIPDEIYGKRVLFVDDSIVRSTTSRSLTLSLLNAGAKEVYAGFASPPIINPCDLGIDMKSKDELIAAKWENESLEEIENKIAASIGAQNVTYLPLEQTISAIGGTIDDYYSYYFGGKHPLRDKHQIFEKRKRKQSKESKIIVLTKDDWINVDTIMHAIKGNKMHGLVSEVIVNKPPNGSMTIIKKHGLTVTTFPSKGIVKDETLRTFYEKRLLDHLKQREFDILLLLKWPFIFSKNFLLEMKNNEVAVINICPSLLTADNTFETSTSRGKIQVVKGLHALEEALKNNLPVAGITVHQVLPGDEVNMGPIIMQEELRITKDLSMKIKEKLAREAEERIIPSALSRALYVLDHNINISQGIYPW